MKQSMRILTLLTFFGLMAFSSQAQVQLKLNGGSDDEEKALTLIEFEQSEYDLGDVYQGDLAKGRFKFKNIGDATLEIDNVKPSCACATLEFPTEPIAPGGEGEIYAEIDTSDKHGDQTKYFTVIYNGNPPVERVKLTFRVVEEEPADGDEGDF